MRFLMYWILLSTSGLVAGMGAFSSVDKGWKIGLVIVAALLFVATSLEAAQPSRFNDDEGSYWIALGLTIPTWAAGLAVMNVSGLVVLPGVLLNICICVLAAVVLALVGTVVARLT